MTESTSAVEQAIAARIARVRAEEERKRQERAEFAAARTAGVARRHAGKLRRLAAQDSSPGSQEVFRGSPDTADNGKITKEGPMPAALRNACCPACRQERPARLVAAVTVAGIPYDVVRCLTPECELLWCLRSNRPRTAPVAA
ncbi:hypothetical protein ACIQVK_21405 [Streptomyces sp. NPDC090493]|uniref:hypothetical protein n=1 Tax=Streptomyces sp. NPDC090493 TaxID=3365964 RepID=UPI00380A642B